MLIRAEAWLAARMFYPPIILLCWVTRQTQYAVHRLLWFVSVLHMFYYSQGIAQHLVLGGLATMHMLSAATRPDVPAVSYGWIRGVLWVSLSLEIMVGLALGAPSHVLVSWTLALYAEYAATIKTLPPPPARRRRRVSSALGA